MQQYSLVTIDTLSRRQTLEIPRVLYKPRKAVTHTQLFDMAAAKWARNEGINSKVRFDPLDPVTIIRYGLTDTRESIRLMGYSFTSPEVVKSLVAAKRRGVDVRVVVDEKGNRSKASQAAMNVVVNAGIPLRTNGQYKIMHDKVIITDGQNVELGSFNYSRSAAESNSENALVVREVPALAQTYLAHWQSRWEGGTDWHSSY